jgi:Domain of unknown function (DUF4124)
MERKIKIHMVNGGSSQETALEGHAKRGATMKATRTVLLILSAIMVSGLMISQTSHAEIYKWVDDKGTVHFTEDPSAIPEKYLDNVKSRTTKEDLMTPEERIRSKRREEERTREQQRNEGGESRVKESEEVGQTGRGEVEMTNWYFTGACASVTMRNGTSAVQEITEWNILAITPKKVVTRYKDPGPRSHRPSSRSPSYNPNPVPAEEKDRFSPRPFLIQLRPGQTQTISICFERDLPNARLELRGL